MIYDFELDGSPSNIRSHSVRGRAHAGFQKLIEAVFALGCVSALYFMLVPQATRCGVGGRRAQCVNNLKQIGLALHAYHETYGRFPPAYVADTTGRPLYSWRVLLLPFLDESDLYGQFDLRQPFDSPHNIALLNKMPGVFRCPDQPLVPRSLSSYVAITGPGTMFPGTASVKLGEVSDGPNQTVMVAETATFGGPWTAPVDLDTHTMSFRINEQGRQSISSGHPGGANVVCGDGRVHFFKDPLPEKELRSLLTINAADWNPDDDGSQSF